MIEVTKTDLTSGFETPLPGERPLSLAEIAAARLATCPYPPLQRLSCQGEFDVVSLRGRVESFYLKQLAQTLVSHIPGVREVQNEVEVVEIGPNQPPRHRAGRPADRTG